MNSKNKPQNVDVPQEAKFLVCKVPNSTSTMQHTIWHHVENTWQSIRETVNEHVHEVFFKDKDHKILPHTYIIRWEVKNINDIDENDMDMAFEEAEASTALASTWLTTYIKTELWNILAFDPDKMILVGEEEIK